MDVKSSIHGKNVCVCVCCKSLASQGIFIFSHLTGVFIIPVIMIYFQGAVCADAFLIDVSFFLANCVCVTWLVPVSLQHTWMVLSDGQVTSGRRSARRLRQ